MNNVTPAVLESFAAELVRRGLPAEYAERAASELADHYRDLVGELQENGYTHCAAEVEAERRLGDARTLAKQTACQYQSRSWCGRWPLFTFVLAPIPIWFLSWIVASMLSIELYNLLGYLGRSLGMAEPSPAALAVLKLIAFGGTTAALAPVVLVLLFYRLARRAGCSNRWAFVSVLQIAFLASLLNFHLDLQRGMLFFEPALLRGAILAPTFSAFLGTYFVQPTQILQFAAPLATLGLFVWLERRNWPLLGEPTASPVSWKQI